MKMFSKVTITLVVFTAALFTGCGTSSSGPNGSKHQTSTGVSETGYPGGQPKDAGSPALASSSEKDHSDSGKPKVPKSE
ncbi:MAG: hypothetical protein ABUS51_01525 [Acidobacteriota bacterium]